MRKKELQKQIDELKTEIEQLKTRVLLLECASTGYAIGYCPPNPVITSNPGITWTDNGTSEEDAEIMILKTVRKALERSEL